VLKTRSTVLVVFLFLLTVLPAVLWGQAATALLNGTVTDPSGAVVPNAELTLTNLNTSVSQKGTTGSEGIYTFPQVPLGTYEFKVFAPGFKEFVQRGITLNLGEKVRIEVKLEVGTAQQVVEVQADASPLNFENAEQKAGIAPETLGELPLIVSGGIRSSATFLTLLPGAASPTGNALDAHLNGSLRYSGEIILNGGSFINPSGGQGLWGAFDFAQSPDMVSEVKVLQADYEPQYGAAAGAVVIMETKSGTNVFHGGAFAYHRNTEFNARQYGRESTARDLENDLGVAIGGPLKAPGLWSNWAKTYFFFNYEAFRQRGAPGRDTMSIPSLKERQGDFTDWLDADLNFIPIFDPASTREVDGQIVRDQFKGCDGTQPNVICPSRISNSLAQEWLKYLPQPTFDGPLNNFIPTGVGSLWKARLNIYNSRLDTYLGDKDHLTVTVWHQDWPTFTESRLPAEISTDHEIYKYTWSERLNWDHVFTPTLLNHFSGGYNHDFYQAAAFNRDFVDALPKIKGVPGYQQPAVLYFGDGFTQLGSGQGLQKWPAPAFVFQDLVTWVKGKHTFKFGFEYRNQRNSWTAGYNEAGELYFDSLNTGLRDMVSGNAIASFLMEQVNSGTIRYAPFGLTSARWSSWIAHAGDTWKVTPKLSLNLGIRWDMHKPTVEQHDVFSFLDTEGPNPGAGGRRGRMVFAGDRWGEYSFGKRNPEDLFKKGFSPRLGIAYTATPQTVVRLGYGIFYDAGYYPGWTGGMANDGFNLSNFSYAGGRDGLDAAFTLSQGFPETWRGYELPVLDASFLNGQWGPLYRPKEGNRLPYAQQWNLAIERQLTENLTITTSYVGTKGTRLISRVAPINAVDPALLQTYGERLYDNFQPGDTSLHGVPLPYDGWVEQMTGCSPSLAQALLPYPQYCGPLQGVNENAGNSSYHSFQLKLDKRFRGGLWMLVSYTASKMLTDTETNQPDELAWNGSGAGTMSPFERQRNKALSTGDIPQVFTASLVYDLPFGRGKRWANGSKALDYVAGGWRLSSITRLHSGAPFHVNSWNCNVPGQFRLGCYPGQLQGTNAFESGTSDFDPANRLLNPSAFEDPNSFNYYYGVGPRVTNLRAFGYRNQDLTLSKSFRITEKVSLQLRGDAFNIFNLHTLRRQDFDTDASSPSFGYWNGGVTDPRTIQVGGRIQF
jgi:hypothetical protein